MSPSLARAVAQRLRRSVDVIASAWQDAVCGDGSRARVEPLLAGRVPSLVERIAGEVDDARPGARFGGPASDVERLVGELRALRDGARSACLREGRPEHAEHDLALLDRAFDRVAALELEAVACAEAGRLQKEVEDELRRDVELRERLLGIVSHDLRNPLSAILASAQLLLRDTHAAPRSLRSAQRIARSAGRMMRMIEALLDFTRIRTGSGIPVERGRADLVAITRQVLEELRLANPERDVLFEVRGDGRGAWDADRLAQVVSNLLGNALTHGADSGPVRIVLDATGDPVDLVVQNQGVIPAEALPALFEPFRRAASPHGARALSGLGLGLYISREIVIAHGGVIAVSSADGGGTTFRVSLPRGGETTGALSG